MASKAVAATPALIYGGFLCLGLILFAIAAAIVLSLIPTFTTSSSNTQYGSVYSIDSFMLKYFYTNSSGNYFLNGTVANSTDLSQRCNSYFQSLGYKNFAGCLVFSGQAWGPNNTGAAARRRRDSPKATMFFIGKALIFRTTSCGNSADKNKTSNSTSVSYCNKQAIKECNSLVNDDAGITVTWRTNPVTLQILNLLGYFESIYITSISGVPRTLAYNVATYLQVDSGRRGELQRGCRFVEVLPLSTINSMLASQTASSVTSATTQATG